MTKFEFAYFEWLYTTVKPSPRSYTKLCEELHRKPFRAFVPNDQNRLEDGCNLRLEYIEHIGEGYSLRAEHLIAQNCSVFEVMVGLAKRLEFQMYDLDASTDFTAKWFMELVTNLRLERFSDKRLGPGRINPLAEAKIDETLEILIERTYDFDGHGSFFPLEKRRRKDRRSLEIWYQMMDYLDEKYG